MTIAEKSYPRKLAFSYLEELSKEFANTYGPKVETVRKPYAFVGFGESSMLTLGALLTFGSNLDTFMNKTARLYRDSRTASAATSNLDKLNDDLQDVTRIMTKNMEELLWRGDSLDSMCQMLSSEILTLTLYASGMSHLSTSLKSESEKYRKAARNINYQAMLRQYAPIGAVCFVVLILLWWRFF